MPTYAPTAEGFNSKVLIEKPRDMSASASGYVWIVAGAASDGRGVTAVVSDRETFTASYQTPTDRRDGGVAYATPDLPPLAMGRYTEGLRLVTVQAGGRSVAHMHSGIEGVLVLEGRVLVRSGGKAPAFLDPGAGFLPPAQGPGPAHQRRERRRADARLFDQPRGRSVLDRGRRIALAHRFRVRVSL
jgi:hypothetical protein